MPNIVFFMDMLDLDHKGLTQLNLNRLYRRMYIDDNDFATFYKSVDYYYDKPMSLDEFRQIYMAGNEDLNKLLFSKATKKTNKHNIIDDKYIVKKTYKKASINTLFPRDFIIDGIKEVKKPDDVDKIFDDLTVDTLYYEIIWGT